MKSFSLSNLLSAIIIAASILGGCYLLQDKHHTDDAIQYGPVMNLAETAAYLHLTVDEINTIITLEETVLESTGSYTGKMFPYFKIDKEIYVSRDELAAWIKEAATNRMQYQ
ncbi:DNA-binding protein [Paenibacillus albus]|uniref:DNA-binding protein n=1 Tax=Paenibacillus albus TaxID=2495582 RepID=A0A3Q8X5H9_9BACL|nr:DNA-binding protein [Paenibacillus albus]AZN40990.1 DNA-binding protein [Paenibacillus albus]